MNIRDSFIDACTDCFQEWKNILQLCITYNSKLQECVFGIFDYYFFAIPLILLSIVRRRSVIINDDINDDAVAAILFS